MGKGKYTVKIGKDGVAMNKDVMIVTGAGQLSMAIARRVGYGKKIILGDKNINNANAIADIMNKAGFDAESVENESFFERIHSDDDQKSSGVR